MQTFTVHTLVDITETNQFRHQPGAELAKNQQQNFSMLLQTIGLRANPMFVRSPKVETCDLKTLFFGNFYTGSHKVWTFEFQIEYDGAFLDSTGNDTGLLIKDLHFVPVIDELTETIIFKLPVFDTDSMDYRNTVVYTEIDK
jgi:hypothetical protein